MSINFHYLLKYVIIGDSGVGKSNILLQYINGKFSDDFKATLGVEFGAKNIEINSRIYRIQIWDTAGQENFRSIARAYYKNSICACIVYDITSRNSFNSVQSWIDDCTKQTPKSILLLLIGNKNDLNDRREVQYEEGAEFAKKRNMIFLETSAKTGNNIDNIFERSVKQIDQNILDNKYDLDNENCGIRKGLRTESFVLSVEKSKEKKKKKCC